MHTCLSRSRPASTSPLPRDALGFVGAAEQVVDDGLVERACSRVSGQWSTVSILSGRSVMIDLSVLSRRRTNGPVTRRSSSVASGSPSRSMGSANRSRNDRADPSSPGLRTCMIDHSSLSRFSTGVPVSATRRRASSCWTALACAVAGFLICCASSRTTRPHATDVSCSRSRASKRVGREHDVVHASPPGEPLLVVAVAIGAVMHEHPELGREARELALPVAEHRHRADDERRAAGRVGEERGDELCGLAEAHVVGEAGTEPEPSEERQPAGSPLLVRPKHAFEAGRRRQWLDGRVERVVEERRQPAKGGGVDAHDLDTVSDAELVDPQPGAQQLPRQSPRHGCRRCPADRRRGSDRSRPTGPVVEPTTALRRQLEPARPGRAW